MGFFFRAYMTREQLQAAKEYVEDLERQLADAEAQLDRMAGGLTKILANQNEILQMMRDQFAKST